MITEEYKPYPFTARPSDLKRYKEREALLRVARAAERLLEQGNQWYGFSGMPGIDKEYKEIVEALEALPPHLRENV